MPRFTQDDARVAYFLSGVDFCTRETLDLLFTEMDVDFVLRRLRRWKIAYFNRDLWEWCIVLWDSLDPAEADYDVRKLALLQKLQKMGHAYYNTNGVF